MKLEQNPLVSIIMNCHNSEQYLREAIESVINQTYSNWELIFWDNKSTDESPLIVQSYKDPRINYYSAISYTPLGQARNLAIEKSKGQYIAFLDDDDIWLPEKLQVQIKIMKDQEYDMVACQSYMGNGVYNSTKK